MKIDRHPLQHCTLHDQTARHAEIAADRKEREVLWQWAEDRKGIYITCPGCSAISRIGSPVVSGDGVIHQCVVCSRCRTHFYVKLEGWDGPFSVGCGICGKAGEITGEDSLPKGWLRGNPGCRCSNCRNMIVCPRCGQIEP